MEVLVPGVLLRESLKRERPFVSFRSRRGTDHITYFESRARVRDIRSYNVRLSKFECYYPTFDVFGIWMTWQGMVD